MLLISHVFTPLFCTSFHGLTINESGATLDTGALLSSHQGRYKNILIPASTLIFRQAISLNEINAALAETNTIPI